LRFRFLNIPVYISPTFWIFLIFFTNIYQDPSIQKVLLGVVLLFSLLVHEYGHALTALYFGARPEITLELLGGYARYDTRGITAKQRFLITLNGPLLQSVLIAFCYYLLKVGVFDNHYYIRYLLALTMRLNILWCLLNLIPIDPLDGGHILRYFLAKRFGDKGHKASIIIGLVCVVAAAPYLFIHGFSFFGSLLIIFGLQNYRMLSHFQSLSREANPFRSYLSGVEAIKNNDLENAKVILKKLLKSKNAQVKNSAAESLAKVYLSSNEPHISYDLLMKADHKNLKEGKCLLCKLAFERKNYELVGKYSRDIYRIEPTFETALLNSKAFAHLNQPNMSGAWLLTASQFEDGCKESIQKLLEHKHYDPVRGHADFQQQIAKIEF
jgi:Zn-dependent protease